MFNENPVSLREAVHRVLLAAAAGMSILSPTAARAAELPVPCAGGSCGASGPSSWVTSGSATALFSGNTLNIQQTTDRAILNWSSFNVGPDGQVIFNQPGRSSIALNRIYQNSPSRIFGQVTANGEIYLVNPNGIVFGRTAKINAAGILASTLDISDSTFASGIAASSVFRSGLPALQSSDHRVYIPDPDHPGQPLRGTIDANGNIIADTNGEPIKVQLTVQEGAALATTGANGRVLLAGQNVDNAGSITANDGQVILAAGDSVFLEASDDPSLRGLAVEVAAGGTAWNRLPGEIKTPRGNATLVGFAVNQDGRVSATTSVAANGSIRLLARDQASITFPGGTPELAATRTGTLEFGSQSVTSVVPELADNGTAVDDQAQLPSHIEAMGRQVTLRGGSVLRANGGRIDVSAVKDPSPGALDASDINDGKVKEPENVPTGTDSQSQLRVESGALVDVSGSDATLPMSRNLVSVELRASELAGSPSQRDGALRGQTVIVDARVGTPLGDVSGALAAIPKSIAERTAQGGQAVFVSDGDVVANAGATFNVSGGTLRYESGAIAASQLIGADGKVYDIGSADPARTYVGIINPVYRRVDDRWGQIELIDAPSLGRIEPGYSHGMDAGTLQFVAPTMLLNSTFVGDAGAGPFQRNPGKVPDGGRFILGLNGGIGRNPSIDYRAPSVELTSTPTPITIADGAALPSGQRLELTADYLHNGFTRTEIYSNGSVTVAQDAPLQLAPGSSFAASGQAVNVLADIVNSGGSIALTSHDPQLGAGAQQPGIFIADGVTLDVRGTWTNDALLDPNVRPTDPLLQNGGSISLVLAGKGFGIDGTPRPAALTLGDDVQLHASAGAAVSRSGAITPGKGGSISLLTNGFNSEMNVGDNVGMDAFGVLGAQGGTFRLTTPRLAVVDGPKWSSMQAYDPNAPRDPAGPAAPSDPVAFFEVGSALFSDYGFATITLGAGRPRESAEDGDILRILPDTHIDARVKVQQLDAQAGTRAGGATIEDFSTVVLPDADQRTASDITFAASLSAPSGITSELAGDLTVGAGAQLRGDVGSHFSFSSVGNAFIDGTILAPGGAITAGLRTPGVDQDAGFIAQQRLQIGSTAVLDVSGAAVFTPNDSFLSGRVVDGGVIDLVLDRGSVLVASGARLDVSGTSATLDVATGNASRPYERHAVASSGGSLQIRAPESIGLYGDVNAFAGSGDIGHAAAGSLTLELSRQRGFGSPSRIETFPTAPRNIELTVGQVRGSSLPDNGDASISQDFIARSGADSLTLRADDGISIRGGVDLSLARSLTLDTPLLSIFGSNDVHLAAPYVSIGNSLPLPTAASSTIGGARLDVDAEFIDIVGSSVLSSMSVAALHSTGDIRLRGTVRTNDAVRPSLGDLSIAGDLVLDAGRVYGSTATQFTVRAGNGTNGRLEILQNGASAGTPLSVGASVRLIAPDIVQGGTLLAPFGSISLEGSHSVSLLDGSETSVSGKGTVFPYGQVAIGQWVYTVDTIQNPVNSIPTRQVAINSDAVSIAPDATIDISGGGDLYAYEWVPGTGGRTDALAPGVTPGLYAVLPSLQGQYAPFDPQEYDGSELTPGQGIYLSGLGDLPAGIYPLLPARYGLLPGAYLVSAVPGTQGIVPGSVASLRDGTRVVAGHTTFGNAQLGNTQYSGFAVRPGSYGRALAQYDDFLASGFFADRAARLELGRVVLPEDAGALSIFAGTQLDARGSVLTDAATGGRDATIDISALRLAVVSGDDAAVDGEVHVNAAQLNEWNPGTLLLGGHEGVDGEFAVSADEVRIGGGVSLAFDQIVLAGHDHVAIESGATVASRSASQTGTLPQLDAEPPALKLAAAENAGAAIVAVSDLAQILPERGDGATRSGSIDIAAGATVASRGAITIDAPAGAVLQGNVRVNDAYLSLGADRIVFGTNAVAGATVIDTGLESSLQNVRALNFSAGSMEFNRNVAINLSAAGSEIDLHTTALSATGNNLSARFAGGTIVLSGSATSASAAAPNGGTSQLQLTADTLQLGPGSTDISGFSQSNWTATRQVIGSGTSDVRISGDLNVTTPLIAFAHDANTSIDVSHGTARLIGAPAVAGQAPSELELGGAFSLVADRIEDSTSIVAASGLISLESRNDLLLGDGASIDVAGRLVTAADRTVGSNGGTVSLTAAGNLSTVATSSLALSGADDSSAGRLHVRAGGTAGLAGSLSAQAGEGAAGGSFDLYANALGNFAALNGALQGGGFTDAQRIRVGTGDLVLAAGTQTTARSVELAADTGSVNVGGTISAPGGDTRGSIQLYGASGVSVLSGAQLHADAGAGGARGGTLELGATSGSVDIAPGSVISAAGAVTDGTLVIRASVDSATNDIKVDRLGADLSDISSVTLAPVFTYDAPTDALAQSDLAGVLDSASSFVATNAAKWSASSSAPVVLRPDIEIRRDGNLTLGGDGSLDLSAWRFGGEAGSLTVRATGSVQVNANISDGVVSDANGTITGLLSGASSSITLAAGADLGSVDPTAVRHGTNTGDLSLNSIVSTGTGSISLTAGRDVIFNAGGSVYTTGVAGTAPQQLLGSLAMFPDQGGSISVRADHDVIGNPPAFDGAGNPINQSVSAWQVRSTRSNPNLPFATLLYGVDIGRFGWNLGTLGGGDLSIAAGNDVRNLSAATADSAIVTADKSVSRFGGGSMTVDAGRDINSGLFFGGQGSLRLHADGALGSGDRFDPGSFLPVGTSLALGNALASIEARNGILLERVLNPTVLLMPIATGSRQSFFFTYGDNTALQLRSATGDIHLSHGADLALNFDEGVKASAAEAFSIYPASVSARAYGGDIVVDSTLTLFPADDGQLDLFAKRDISTSQASQILMSDGAATAVPQLGNPQGASSVAIAEVLKFAAASRHVNDLQPSLVTAGRDIRSMIFVMAEAARYSAGRDIGDVTILGQNMRPTDLTLISAGRDFTYASNAANQTQQVSLGGPGELGILAGRDVDLGFTAGITTTGRGANPSLPSAAGAGITVVAGLGKPADYAGFIERIIAPTHDYDARLVAYVLSVTGTTKSAETALATFRTLTVDMQRPFIDAVFFNELVRSGREANATADAGFRRGYAAIDALFPASGAASGDVSQSPYHGDLNMAFSRIYTLAGGDISLLIPGGLLNVGLANPPPAIANREASQLGIVAQGEGSVRVFADRDVLVNSSRIFTLLGGDIAVWSTHGNIDAGRGAKSSLSAPPPTVTIDDSGAVVVSFTGAVAGSGIRTIVTSDEIEPGDVDLIAPSGFVNAGDAGIGSAGNLNIAAQHVIGLDNIQVGGASTGVPAETSGLGASLSGVTAASSSSSNAANGAVAESESKKDAAPQLSQAALSWLDVFVVGLGEEGCKQDDVECLKRQQ
jgi:filamentous hemagglutinin family protein